jgi:hypothetical protein
MGGTLTEVLEQGRGPTSAVVPLRTPRSSTSCAPASMTNWVMWKRCSADTAARHRVPEPPECARS